VDSFEEIDRIEAVAASLGVVAPVMVRVTVGVEAHTHEYIATAHEDQKFGFSLAGGQAAEAVRQILQRPDRMSLRGLHSHIGSQIFDVSGFEVAARRVIDLRLQILRDHGVEVPEVDLGGGFGIAYTTQHDPLTPRDLAIGMAEIIGRACRADGVSVPRISIEPGRAIAGPSTFTLYEVGTVKDVLLDGNASRTYVAVDGGMSDNPRPVLYGSGYEAFLPRATDAPRPRTVTVVGKHCESGDVVVRDAQVPADLAVGDILCTPVTGAYGHSMASNYNKVPRPAVVFVRDGTVREVVRREREDDLLRLDQ
jgi:diaminopimelate decarboxylase